MRKPKAQKNLLIETDVSFIRRDFFSRWRPPDPRPSSEWIVEHVRLPFSSRRGRPDLELTPYLRKPLDYAAGDKILNGHRVKEIMVTAAVQSAKSTLEEGFACWVIDQDGGPMMWNFQSDPDAKETSVTRIQKIFKATKPIKARLPGGDRETTMMIVFDHMFLIIQGAQTRLNLQQKSIRWVLNDETWLWPPGHLDEARKRTTSYWNSMFLSVSTGSIKDDDTDLAFRAGTMEEWKFCCPKCGTVQAFQVRKKDDDGKVMKGGVSWDDNVQTRDPETGDWNYTAVTKTVRYECESPACDKTWTDSEKSRREMNLTADFYALNNNPEPGRISFHWNALCVPWISWADVLIEFLKAMDAAKLGVMTQLQEWVQKRMGQAWEVRGVEDKVTVPSSDYDMLEDWELMKFRFMTVDVQSDHFWIVVRDWSEMGESRLVWTGKVQTYDDVREKQIEMRIPDRSVGIDSSYGQGAGGRRSVYFQCCRFGWIAIEGSDREYFPRHKKDSRITYRSPLSKVEAGDPLEGAKASDKMNPRLMKTRACPLVKWSNPAIKDILEGLSRGRGAMWEIARNTPPFWHEHMRSEIKKVTPDKTTGRPIVEYVLVDKKQVHTRDCECMQIVMAILGKVLGDEASLEEDKGEEKKDG